MEIDRSRRSNAFLLAKINTREKLRENYFTNNNYFIKKQIDDIIYNENKHIVAKFKEFLIFYDDNEFLNKFYNSQEIDFLIPFIIKYYINFSKIIPNYIPNKHAKLIHKNVKKKLRLLYDKNKSPELLLAKEENENKTKMDNYVYKKQGLFSSNTDINKAAIDSKDIMTDNMSCRYFPGTWNNKRTKFIFNKSVVYSIIDNISLNDNNHSESSFFQNSKISIDYIKNYIIKYNDKNKNSSKSSNLNNNSNCYLNDKLINHLLCPNKKNSTYYCNNINKNKHKEDPNNFNGKISGLKIIESEMNSQIINNFNEQMQKSFWDIFTEANAFNLCEQNSNQDKFISEKIFKPSLNLSDNLENKSFSNRPLLFSPQDNQLLNSKKEIKKNYLNKNDSQNLTVNSINNQENNNSCITAATNNANILSKKLKLKNLNILDNKHNDYNYLNNNSNNLRIYNPSFDFEDFPINNDSEENYYNAININNKVFIAHENENLFIQAEQPEQGNFEANKELNLNSLSDKRCFHADQNKEKEISSLNDGTKSPESSKFRNFSNNSKDTTKHKYLNLISPQLYRNRKKCNDKDFFDDLKTFNMEESEKIKQGNKEKIVPNKLLKISDKQVINKINQNALPEKNKNKNKNPNLNKFKEKNSNNFKEKYNQKLQLYNINSIKNNKNANDSFKVSSPFKFLESYKTSSWNINSKSKKKYTFSENMNCNSSNRNFENVTNEIDNENIRGNNKNDKKKRIKDDLYNKIKVLFDAKNKVKSTSKHRENKKGRQVQVESNNLEHSTKKPDAVVTSVKHYSRNLKIEDLIRDKVSLRNERIIKSYNSKKLINKNSKMVLKINNFFSTNSNTINSDKTQQNNFSGVLEKNNILSDRTRLNLKTLNLNNNLDNTKKNGKIIDEILSESIKGSSESPLEVEIKTDRVNVNEEFYEKYKIDNSIKFNNCAIQNFNLNTERNDTNFEQIKFNKVKINFTLLMLKIYNFCTKLMC